MMGKFTSRNSATIYGSAKRRGGSGLFSNLSKLRVVAQEVLETVRDSIPYDTGNLMDGTGVGIYIDGILSDFRYENQATVPQKFHGQYVWGKETLTKALSAGSSEYVNGVWIVIFSTVPYAIYQDKLSGFFSGVMKSNFKYMVLSQFKLK